MKHSEDVANLIAEGARLYAAKVYDEASEKYALACEQHRNHNHEDDPDILLMYGKALFQNAVINSEIFGTNATKQSTQNRISGDDAEKEEASDNSNENFHFHAGSNFEEQEEEEETTEPRNNDGQKSDDKSDDSEDDELQDDKDDESAENQSDFEIAWEILDLTRCLFEQQLEACTVPADLKPPYLATDAQEPESQYLRTMKKLSETYDLLGEVSLEAENFQQAAEDLQYCLELRLKLHDSSTSRLLAESHYKLLLALEYCLDDPDLRQKAAEQVRLAIEAVKLRSAKEKAEENNKEESASKSDTSNQDPAEDESLLRDLQIRYDDLSKDPEQSFTQEKMEIMQGLLGAVAERSGSSEADLVNNLTAAVKRKNSPANDLSASVKRKKKKGPQ